MNKLAGDVEHDPDVVNQFVSDYLGLLDHRMDRLGELLSDDEAVESIRVLILSLETTSAMLGGDEVAAAARDLRLAVAADLPTEAAYEELVRATHSLRRLLTSSATSREGDLRSELPPGPADA